MLPEKVLRLIREFSRSLTRPDWKTCKKLTQLEYEILLNNSLMNRAIRNMFNNYHFSTCFSFTIKPGQTFYYKRMIYRIDAKYSPSCIVVYNSYGDKFIGSTTINYKQCMVKNELHRMEGVYIKKENKTIYLSQNNYISKQNI